MTKVVLVDNYDSFTWNIYEYLSREGADVHVHRNDKISIDEIAGLEPDLIVISPGPGHPLTDSGISRQVIRSFAGKVPIFGVCMGMQCIAVEFGGVVEFAGEIVHGKTSPVFHNGTGAFKNISQGTLITRYHSLAPAVTHVPDCLEITGRTENGVIQGLRHKEMLLEGVQFHPESIMSLEGRNILQNVLKYRGGYWKDLEQNEAKDTTKSILTRIYENRQKEVTATKALPGRSFADLERSVALGLAPEAIDFYKRLDQPSKHLLGLLAEIKRASPSKGDIGVHVHPATQATKYARAGAAAISVLTEPTWFKGDLEDMRQVRLVVSGLADRPAVLRKEFIFDEYQILEARLFGADSVLLIVKMLPQPLLERLYKYSQSIGMEPLVEVSDADEMTRANELGARVVGVNNRNLHTFEVDLSASSQLVKQAGKGTILAALSGITSNAEVRKYASQGVRAVLIGEALMRAKNTEEYIEQLLSDV